MPAPHNPSPQCLNRRSNCALFSECEGQLNYLLSFYIKVQTRKPRKKNKKIFFSLQVEDDCTLTTVDDIATAVYQMLGRIQEEAMIN